MVDFQTAKRLIKMRKLTIIFILITSLSFGQNDSITIVKMSKSNGEYDIERNDSLSIGISRIVSSVNLYLFQHNAENASFCSNLRGTALMYTITLNDSKDVKSYNLNSCESCEEFNNIFINELGKLDKSLYNHINDELKKNQFNVILLIDENGFIDYSDVY